MLSQALALAEMDLSRLPSEQQQTLRSLRQQIRELEHEMRLPADTPARRDERTLAAALAQARKPSPLPVGMIPTSCPRDSISPRFWC